MDEPTEPDIPEAESLDLDAPNPSVVGSMHLSLSNIISYMFVSAAGALAFFFAFQATLLSGYPRMYALLSDKVIRIWSWDFEIGKLGISFLCLLIAVFTYWSYKVIVIFEEYMASLLASGAALEKSANISKGIYTPFLGTFDRIGTRGRIPIWSRIFIGMVLTGWVVLAIVVWVR